MKHDADHDHSHGLSYRYDHDPPQNPLPHEDGASHNSSHAQREQLIEKGHADTYRKAYTKIGTEFRRKGLLK